jgi:hypothetical protein
MTQYLLTVYHPEVGPESPPPANVEEIMRDVAALNDELRAAGAWVFAGGLAAPSTATVVRLEGDSVAMTDGPFIRAEEPVGGMWIINADDEASALEWGRKATRAARIPVEVRAFQEEPEA